MKLEEYTKKRSELEKAVAKNQEQQYEIYKDFFKEHNKVMEQLEKAKAKMDTKLEEKEAERIALRDEILRLDLYYTKDGEE